MNATERDPYQGQTRKQYLKGLAVDFGLPYSIVAMAASILGPNEDFDGLISELENAAESGEFEDCE
jgi:hypothetical protein